MCTLTHMSLKKTKKDGVKYLKKPQLSPLETIMCSIKALRMRFTADCANVFLGLGQIGPS